MSELVGQMSGPYDLRMHHSTAVAVGLVIVCHSDLVPILLSFFLYLFNHVYFVKLGKLT